MYSLSYDILVMCLWNDASISSFHKASCNYREVKYRIIFGRGIIFEAIISYMDIVKSPCIILKGRNYTC